jgi:ABC-type multidrug transport system ATPase subunit
LTPEERKATGKRMGRQKVVKSASGYAMPGTTLYIMGSSGAGKTSLLNMLSDRISLKNGATCSGKVMIND